MVAQVVRNKKWQVALGRSLRQRRVHMYGMAASWCLAPGPQASGLKPWARGMQFQPQAAVISTSLSGGIQATYCERAQASLPPTTIPPRRHDAPVTRAKPASQQPHPPSPLHPDEPWNKALRRPYPQGHPQDATNWRTHITNGQGLGASARRCRGECPPVSWGSFTPPGALSSSASATFRSAFIWLCSLTADRFARAWSGGLMPTRAIASRGPRTGLSMLSICLVVRGQGGSARAIHQVHTQCARPGNDAQMPSRHVSDGEAPHVRLPVVRASVRPAACPSQPHAVGPPKGSAGSARGQSRSTRGVVWCTPVARAEVPTHAWAAPGHVAAPALSRHVTGRAAPWAACRWPLAWTRAQGTRRRRASVAGSPRRQSPAQSCTCGCGAPRWPGAAGRRTDRCSPHPGRWRCGCGRPGPAPSGPPPSWQRRGWRRCCAALPAALLRAACYGRGASPAGGSGAAPTATS